MMKGNESKLKIRDELFRVKLLCSHVSGYKYLKRTRRLPIQDRNGSVATQKIII